MKNAPIRPWRPRGPSPSLRRRIFENGPESTGAYRLGVPWIRAGLIVLSVWMCALTVVWSPSGATAPNGQPCNLAGVSALVAQNCLPVASFTLTNRPIFPGTNASQNAL